MAPPTALRGIDDARRTMYRQQILEAAEREFARAGFDNAKMSAIARSADLALATVYKHFAGKAEIWDALHAARMTELLAHVDAAPSADSSVDRLLSSVGAVADYLVTHDAYLDLSLWAGTGWASHVDGVGVQRTVWAAGIDQIARGIESALGRGEIPAIPPRVAAGLVVASLQVWLAEWVRTGRTEEPAPMIEAMSARLRSMLIGA